MRISRRSYGRGRALAVLATIAAIATALVLPACGHSAGDPAAPSGDTKPATAVPIPGTDEKRVILTADAASRVGIRTAPVRRISTAGGAEDVIPVSAVYYDGTGATWIYTSPAPYQYVRAAVTLGPITGDTVVLVRGPAPGTSIVTVGEAELYGVEFGVGGEQ